MTLLTWAENREKRSLGVKEKEKTEDETERWKEKTKAVQREKKVPEKCICNE